MATIKEAIEYSKINPDSAFATELRRRIESGEMDSELQSAGLTQFMKEKPSAIDRFANTAKDYAKEAVTNPVETLKGVAKGIPGLAAQTTKAVEGIGKAVLPDIGTSQTQNSGLDYSAVEELTAPSNKAQQVGYVAGGLLPVERVVGGVNLAVKGIKGGTDIAKTGVNAGVEAIKSGANTVAETPIVSGVGNVLKGVSESAKRIPSRMATNAAEKQATEQAISSLPTKTAQIAVRDGVDIVDVKDLSNIEKTPQVNKLIQTVKNYANGDRSIDPIEVVGEPIIKQVKSLDTKRKVIGKSLGEASKSIGVLTKPELESGVLAKLQQVPGLENLTITPKGLSFKGTTLESSLSKADRNAISEAFREATKWGDGIKAHNFRQTLFENLGGKKKSLANITDTQERSFEAIRSGLSDVIESRSPSYKKLSNEYREIVQPLSDLRKLMKNIDPNSTEDILNMSAGLLARRITSAASSNPQIKQLLANLDKASGANLKQGITELQDVYNILNKYYDIAPKTGFQNLVKEGVGSDSVVGIVKETLKDVAGQSNAVRQKALENLLDELGSVAK